MSERVERCRKCRSEDLWTAWHQDGHDCSYAERKQEGGSCCGVDEHLHRGCRNCGFSWKEPTREQEGSQLAAKCWCGECLEDEDRRVIAHAVEEA